MAGRPNWHYNHPPACTCAECDTRRRARVRQQSPREGQQEPDPDWLPDNLSELPRPPRQATNRPERRKSGSGRRRGRGFIIFVVVVGIALLAGLGECAGLYELPGSGEEPQPDVLRQFALDLINRDRADRGLPLVVLGTNQASQLHAEDMLAHGYVGHWWADGRKPYMVYSQTGGKSYVAENAASSGWTDQQWGDERCSWPFFQCSTPGPREAIEELHTAMMYDDAHADWGHRDNILREGHRAVNIGIAWNDRRVTFSQHFEGGDVEADAPPALSADGLLSLSLAKRIPGVSIGGVISVYYDPLPTPKTPQQIDALDSYCVGGGFTTGCGDPVARILDPPGPGRFYSNLDANEVIADAWAETADSFSFTASLGSLATTPGVYTVTIWRASETSLLTEGLAELSVVQP